jgi:hypothetical protein
MPRILPVLAVSAGALLTFSAHAQNCAPFTDVLASSGFCSNIQWLFNRGITTGCTATQYCPANFVRRDQMAAFLNRLADNAVFQQGGNAFGVAAKLGTTDGQPLEVIANNSRVMRYEPNSISPNVIGGSPANGVTAGVRGATIAGGGVPSGDTDPVFPNEAPNRVTDVYGTVGGGYANRAGDDAGSTTDAPFATVAGGFRNTASALTSTVAGGQGNTASGIASTVAGGQGNTASANSSTVAGGANNTAITTDSTVAGGANNTASGNASTVAGGLGNTASGSGSFAAGSRANANANGCFVWGDASTGSEVLCDAANRFVVRTVGGSYFITSGTSQATYNGVLLAAGGTAWVFASDRRLKENLHTIDTRDILDRLLALPITSWNLKSQDPSIRHLGPMAQDFRLAFGLGETELGINTLDADGVAFAAIQGLNAKLEAKLDEQSREIVNLREQHAAELAKLRRAYEELLARLATADTLAAQ